MPDGVATGTGRDRRRSAARSRGESLAGARVAFDAADREVHALSDRGEVLRVIRVVARLPRGGRRGLLRLVAQRALGFLPSLTERVEHRGRRDAGRPLPFAFEVALLGGV